MEVTLPPAERFRDCSGQCYHYAGETSWFKTLQFQDGEAIAVFPVPKAHFGVNFNRTYAYAAIPDISVTGLSPQQSLAAGKRVLLPALSAKYQIATA
ncbi:MAG TPA: hypothetical protein VGS19_35850, partial [Streptosporangiaceae bacterium]|nr:hypothetical protein [Streptosporangiaceae bacterium]